MSCRSREKRRFTLCLIDVEFRRDYIALIELTRRSTRRRPHRVIGDFAPANKRDDSNRTHRKPPSSPALIAAVEQGDSGESRLAPLYEEAIRDTIERFEATGSPVVTDGEQRRYQNLWTYCVHGLPNTAPEGFRIPFAPAIYGACRG